MYRTTDPNGSAAGNVERAQFAKGKSNDVSASDVSFTHVVSFESMPLRTVFIVTRGTRPWRVDEHQGWVKYHLKRETVNSLSPNSPSINVENISPNIPNYGTLLATVFNQVLRYTRTVLPKPKIDLPFQIITVPSYSRRRFFHQSTFTAKETFHARQDRITSRSEL